VIHPFNKSYSLQQTSAGDGIWREDLCPLFGGIRENVLGICNYGFTEIFKNAVDHSEGTKITVGVEFSADLISMTVIDDGTGIFNKIWKKYTLDDPRHALLELSKGRLTTDPKSRKGEGIFFTSHMFDTFIIASGNLTSGHKAADLFIADETEVEGTAVIMKISPLSDRTTEEVISQFVGGSGLDKTIVPVRLVQSGKESLTSRSQAKKLLARLDRFSSVVLDFAGVDGMGRGFADEVFRVFARSRPGTILIPIHENADIKALIAEMTGGS
jgi:anti-sigma regulatory factor (Ser/Thr protein kinase)